MSRCIEKLRDGAKKMGYRVPDEIWRYGEMRQRLLIVDDEPGMVGMMRRYFSDSYEVMTAMTGEEAVQKAAGSPDLILLDINMPGMDGLTVCERIRKYVTCPILFLTARVESSDKIRGFQAGG